MAHNSVQRLTTTVYNGIKQRWTPDVQRCTTVYNGCTRVYNGAQRCTIGVQYCATVHRNGSTTVYIGVQPCTTTVYTVYNRSQQRCTKVYSGVKRCFTAYNSVKTLQIPSMLIKHIKQTHSFDPNSKMCSKARILKVSKNCSSESLQWPMKTNKNTLLNARKHQWIHTCKESTFSTRSLETPTS